MNEKETNAIKLGEEYYIKSYEKANQILQDTLMLLRTREPDSVTMMLTMMMFQTMSAVELGKIKKAMDKLVWESVEKYIKENWRIE